MQSLDTLNDRQKEAVITTEGPLLIIAGAGSGKTRVLTHRTAYLIEEKGVNPYNIMAITFTNKAAEEMRQRIDKIVGYGSESIWVCTFHSTCVRILRRFADRIGYENNFTIYDSDDSKQVMKEVCKRLNIDTKFLKEKTILSKISSAKDELVGYEEFENTSASDFNSRRIAAAYREYQISLKKNNAMDFDDLIFNCVRLLRTDDEVRENFSKRFEYIMVDEYQDTNTAQFQLVKLLASYHSNLCVVGDDDQSIYKFRGANIRNILNFEELFPGAKTIKLEQNYRSSQNILDAANAVIANNNGRKNKSLWTSSERGDSITFRQFETGFDEADFVAKDIAAAVKDGKEYSDHAVLYRTNAQSRLFEERFIDKNIPYKIVGGVNFYSRKEIKDVLAYLKTIDNARDDLAVTRIINIPKRGIGATSIAKIQDYAMNEGISFYQACKEANDIEALGKAATKINGFVNFIQVMKSKMQFLSIPELIEELLDETGYREELELEETPEADARLENLDEFISKASTYEEGSEEPSLSGFLEEVALVADIDDVDMGDDYVLLMTLHSAKGLEFDHVYLAGMEDGLFPSFMSITAEDSEAEIEEERRLCYVGITRAERLLTISAARSRMVRGEIQFSKVSRFVSEIPNQLMTATNAYGYKIKSATEGDEIYDRKKDDRLSSEALKILRTKPYVTTAAKAFGSSSSNGGSLEPLEYGVGDRVRHFKFGEGQVTEVIAGGRDYEVTVDFDNFGTKKMFAGFAKLKKV